MKVKLEHLEESINDHNKNTIKEICIYKIMVKKIELFNILI